MVKTVEPNAALLHLDLKTSAWTAFNVLNGIQMRAFRLSFLISWRNFEQALFDYKELILVIVGHQYQGTEAHKCPKKA